MPHVNVHGYQVKRIKGRDYYVHRLVMAEHLGRELDSDEHVHHVDGDKLNNHLDNLMILSNSDHQREHRLGTVRNPERRARILELSDDGYSQNAIARELGINQSVVSRYLSRKVK
jgi:DNA-binding NarL/FixJ family response regulator